MFWTDWEGGNSRIERATLSGGQRTIVFDIWGRLPGSEWPNGIACDMTSTRIFWVDARSDSVHTVFNLGLMYIVVPFIIIIIVLC